MADVSSPAIARSIATGRRLHGVLPLRPRPVRRRGSPRDAGHPPADHLSRTRSTTAASARGRRRASSAAGTTTTSRLVAGMRRVDTERLTARGSRRSRRLGRPPPRRPSPRCPERDLRAASASRRGSSSTNASTGDRVYELFAPGRRSGTRGLGILPEPSPWDVFFDIEADPWAARRRARVPASGSSTVDGDLHRLSRDLGHDPGSRRTAALRAVPRLVICAARRAPGDARLPLRRLRGRRPQAPDAAATARRGRGRPPAARRCPRRPAGRRPPGVRASVESYSLKQIEKFYCRSARAPVTDAGFSVVAFERWLRDARRRRSSMGSRRTTATTASQLPMLRDWLEARRVEAMGRWPDRTWTPAGARGRRSRPRSVTRWLRLVASTVVGADRRASTAADGATRHARGVCWPSSSTGTAARRSRSGGAGSSSREDSSSTSARRRSATRSAGSSSSASSASRRRASSAVPVQPQDHDFGRAATRPSTAAERQAHRHVVVELDDVARDRSRSSAADRVPTARIPAPSSRSTPIEQPTMQAALLESRTSPRRHGIDGAGPLPRGRATSCSAGPRGGRSPSASLVPTGRGRPRGRAGGLRSRSSAAVLPIQGPPGTGKTYTGARMILDLIRRRKRVGITAQSTRRSATSVEAVARCRGRRRARIGHVRDRPEGRRGRRPRRSRSTA